MTGQPKGATFQVHEPISVQMSTISNTPYHQHKFLEMAYITEGSAIHIFQEKASIVRKGDYFAINYNEFHKFSTNGNEPFQVINILFLPEFLDPSLKECKGFPSIVENYSINYNYFNLKTSPTSIIYQDDTGEVLIIFQKILKEYREQAPKYHELLRCYLTELIIITLRKIHNSGFNTNCTNETLNRILNQINETYMNPIRLKDISTSMGYSESYLSWLFTSKLGISFSKYLQNVRISNACNLLSHTDKGVEEISIACGYHDVKFFRQTFKSKIKMSPLEFRRKSRKSKID